MFYLLLAILILQISVLIIGDHIKHLRNDGRRSNQSEEDFQKQLGRWTKAQNTLQSVASLWLLLYLLHIKGII